MGASSLHLQPKYNQPQNEEKASSAMQSLRAFKDPNQRNKVMDWTVVQVGSPLYADKISGLPPHESDFGTLTAGK